MASKKAAAPLVNEAETLAALDEGEELDEAAFLAEEAALLASSAAGAADDDVALDEDEAALADSKKSKAAKSKAAKQDASADDEEDLDGSAADEEEYAEDDEDAADGGADEAAEGEAAGEVDEAEDTHGAVVTPKRGHRHGKYDYHTHADDGDHADAALMPAAEAGKMSERRAGRTGTLAASAAAGDATVLGLGDLATFLSAASEADDDAPITLAEAKQMRAALRQLAEERYQLQERAYREDVTRLAEGFAREFRLSEKPGDRVKVAPSRVFRQRFEAFMLSDLMRGADDADRDAFLKLLDTAYRKGAVPTTQLSERDPDASAPPPPAELGSRADLPAAARTAGGASTGASGNGSRSAPEPKSRVVLLAEGRAPKRFGKPWDEITPAQRNKLLLEAATEAGYRGAER